MTSTDGTDNFYAPPLAHVEDVRGTTLELASRLRRLVAALIDGLLQGVGAWAIVFVVWNGGPFGGGMTSGIGFGVLAGFAAFLIIQGYLLANHGQTVAKRVMGMRIVRSDGSRASAARLIGRRYLLNMVLSVIPVLGWLYGLVDALMIFRDSRQCVHDNLADTIVVKV